MIHKTLIRSALQLVGLCFAAFMLSSTPVKASEIDCEELAAECAAYCGTTYNMETFYIWDSCAYMVNNQCVADWRPVIVGTFGPGVESFECEEETEYYHCACAY